MNDGQRTHATVNGGHFGDLQTCSPILGRRMGDEISVDWDCFDLERRNTFESDCINRIQTTRCSSAQRGSKTYTQGH